MATKYRQISLKDTFSDCQDMFMDDARPFFSSMMNTLTSGNSSPLSSPMLFISISAENAFTL